MRSFYEMKVGILIGEMGFLKNFPEYGDCLTMFSEKDVCMIKFFSKNIWSHVLLYEKQTRKKGRIKFSGWFLMGFIFRGILAPIKDIHVRKWSFQRVKFISSWQKWMEFFEKSCWENKDHPSPSWNLCILTFNIFSESCISLLEFLMKCVPD